MRRTTITLTAALALLVIAPSGALASRHHRHHRRHHHARIERFGTAIGAPTSSSSADTAGTVQSFNNGVLTIMLNDGSTVSGAVTNDTEIECEAADTMMSAHEDGGGTDGTSGDTSSGDGVSGDNEAENENEVEMNCSTANLTPGTVVKEAELRISSTGSVWKDLELEL
jgi:hypothetical protein